MEGAAEARSGRWRRARSEATAPVCVPSAPEAPPSSAKLEAAEVAPVESRWRRQAEPVPDNSAKVGLLGDPTNIGPSAAIVLRSGLRVPALGFGTRQLMGAECRDAVRAALRCGYGLLDTAPTYGNEEDVANGIRASGLKREDVFLVTRLPVSDHGGVDEVLESLAGSLRRLGTAYVDLYLIQSPKGGSILETWDAMLAAKRQGLALAVGVSNFGMQHLEGLKGAGREMPEVNALELHFAHQMLPNVSYCSRLGIALMATTPLARGRLFRGQTALGVLAAKKGRTEAELAVRWCLQKGFITIPKTKDAKRVESNAPFGFSLTESDMTEMAALDTGSAVSVFTKSIDLPWEAALDEVSEVSDEDLGDGRVLQRRRRRRPRKGKGKGKGAGKGAINGQSPGTGRGSGPASRNPMSTVMSLS